MPKRTLRTAEEKLLSLLRPTDHELGRTAESVPCRFGFLDNGKSPHIEMARGSGLTCSGFGQATGCPLRGPV